MRESRIASRERHRGDREDRECHWQMALVKRWHSLHPILRFGDIASQREEVGSDRRRACMTARLDRTYFPEVSTAFGVASTLRKP